MGHLLKRYLGWYVWLAAFCAVIGGVVGLACFAVVLLPLVALSITVVLPVAVAYATPLNVLILPIAFHRLRNSQRRRTLLRATGLLGGFISPGLIVLAVKLSDPVSGSSIGNALLLADQWGPIGLLVFSAVGAVAGLICANLFDRYGDKPSPFDVNTSLEALRSDETRLG